MCSGPQLQWSVVESMNIVHSVTQNGIKFSGKKKKTVFRVKFVICHLKSVHIKLDRLSFQFCNKA